MAEKSIIAKDQTLHIRDCYQQLRGIGRLLSMVEDDLGDLSIDRSLPNERTTEFQLMQDSISSIGAQLQTFRERLQTLSRQ